MATAAMNTNRAAGGLAACFLTGMHGRGMVCQAAVPRHHYHQIATGPILANFRNRRAGPGLVAHAIPVRLIEP